MVRQTIRTLERVAIRPQIKQGSAMKNKVYRSIEAPGGGVCVDLFQRPDDSWGFEEYRRDVEDGKGWFTTGFLGETRYESSESAESAALKHIPWLVDVPR